MHALPLAAATELILSLALAWLGVLALYVRPPALTQIFPRPVYIIKAHIDYLLMSLFLFVFFLLHVPLPGWIVGCAIVGSLTNPLLFLVLAMYQQPDMRATSPIGAASVLSFIITTLGFGGTAVVVLLHHGALPAS